MDFTLQLSKNIAKFTRKQYLGNTNEFWSAKSALVMLSFCPVVSQTRRKGEKDKIAGQNLFRRLPGLHPAYSSWHHMIRLVSYVLGNCAQNFEL